MRCLGGLQVEILSRKLDGRVGVREDSCIQDTKLGAISVRHGLKSHETG